MTEILGVCLIALCIFLFYLYIKVDLLRQRHAALMSTTEQIHRVVAAHLNDDSSYEKAMDTLKWVATRTDETLYYVKHDVGKA
jgi:hypothetical protein